MSSLRRRSGGRRGFRTSAALAALIAMVALVVAGLVLAATKGMGSNTSPSADVSSPKDTPSASPTSTPKHDNGVTPLQTRSTAAMLSIPAMGLHTKLTQLGSTKQQTMQLPQPRRAGWFTGSVAPGQPGVSVVAGFIRGNSQVPGVFAHLNKLKAHQQIAVRRADGKTATYRVDSIHTYASGHFPTDKVYIHTTKPLLRLVTTGGSLHRNDPRGNVVVYAHLIATR